MRNLMTVSLILFVLVLTGACGKTAGESSAKIPLPSNESQLTIK